MIMKHWHYILLFFPLIFCFCSKTQENSIKIIRFDKELKHTIDNYSDSALINFENEDVTITISYQKVTEEETTTGGFSCGSSIGGAGLAIVSLITIASAGALALKKKKD